MSPLRIVHATSVHRWDDGRIFERQCRSLARRGHHVTLLAPGDGQRVVDDVRVVGIGTASGRRDRMTGLVRSIRRRLPELDPDVVVFHDPELLQLVITSRRIGRVVVYDAHEDYSAQIRDKEWLPPWVRGVAGATLGRLELLAARRADLVLCATPRIAQRFGAARAEVVLNRPTLQDVPPLDSIGAAGRGGDVARLVYVGDLRPIRGALALVDAMEIVNRTRPARLDIAGRMTPTSLADELARRPGWAFVDVGGWQSRDDLYGMLDRADVAMLPFLHALNHVESQPNKLFEYFMMGLPVVATDFPLWAQLADECGARLEPSRSGDPASIAAAVSRVLAGPPSGAERLAGAARARTVHAWEAIEPGYVAVIEAAAARR